MRAEPGDGEIEAFVRATGRRTRLPAHAPVFFEGDRSTSVYLCLEGRIRLFVTGSAGHEILVQDCRPGSLFGELSALTGRPRPASATAAVDSVVAHVPGERYLRHLDASPVASAAALRALAGQLHGRTRRLVARSNETAMSRTGHRLVELAARAEHDLPVGSSVVVDVVQADLADWVGATRESVSRALAAYRRAGVIATGRGHIEVHDVRRLAQLADSC